MEISVLCVRNILAIAFNLHFIYGKEISFLKEMKFKIWQKKNLTGVSFQNQVSMRS